MKAKINGKGDFSFIFDTGAQGVVLNESVANSLSLKGEGVTPLGSPNDPNAYQAKNIDIPLMSINGFEAKNEEAVAVDFAKVFPNSKHDGIFGLSTFKGNLVTINYRESKLVITKGELREGDPGVMKADLSRILTLTAKLNGKDIPVHLDSGSPGSVTFPMEWKPILSLKSEPVLRGKARTASGEIDLYSATMEGKIEVGSITIIDPEITLITGGFPAANLGFLFMRNYLLTIDMVNRRLRMDPFDKTPASDRTTQSSRQVETTDCGKYAGDYQNRKVTCEGGQMYSQRIISDKDQSSSGPTMIAPKLKLIPDGNDAFRIEGVPNGRIKFIRDTSGSVVEMQVLNPQGEWEKSRKAAGQSPAVKYEQTENSTTFEIPFTLEQNRPIVNLRMGAKNDLRFIFDTGAQGIVLSEKVASDLGLRSHGITRVGSPNNPVAIEAKRVAVPSVGIGGFEITNQNAVAIDFDKMLPGLRVDGLLGLSFFRGYLVTINYAESKLTIAKGELTEGGPGVIRVDLSEILALTAKLNGKDMPIHLDSGAPSLLMMPIEWKPNLTLKSEPVFFRKARTSSGVFDLYKAELLGKIEIGEASLIDPEITLATSGFPAANLGFAFMRNYVWTIDTVNERMRMDPVKKA
ncbi:MAG: aspartyl protease family protein [Pyrinomonadaceae bacterium]